MAPLGKALVVVGIAMAALGLVLWAGGSIPLIGRLPGDIYIRRGNFAFYFPLTTCIVISVVLGLLLAVMRR